MLVAIFFSLHLVSKNTTTVFEQSSDVKHKYVFIFSSDYRFAKYFKPEM